MRFHLFGAVQVMSGGEVVDVGRRRERGLLAALLLDAGWPVGTGRLIDLLCADAPDPRKALQVHVSRLRKRLPGVRLDTLATGYALRVDPETVDLHQFTRLVAQARLAADPRDRARIAGRALALQRGPICADLPFDRLHEVIHARYDEVCVAVHEIRVEAELALGKHETLVNELAELTARHPTRERLVAARMTALYRTGRIRDALDVYQLTARALADELGIDPSPELRDLHTAILREAPELTAPGRTAPAQLPAGPRTFTGRRAELAELVDAPGNTVVISAINGMAGVGKTTLAVHAAHQLAGDYPDGQLFVDLHGFTRSVTPADPAAVLDRLLGALGVPGDQIPEGLEDRSALYRSKLAGKRVLVLLDNAASESQVRPLLPATAGCLALITSRRDLTGLEHARPVPVDLLDPADAVALFRSVAGIGPHPLLATVVELCGRLPLAIQLAAARLRARPSWTLDYLVELLSGQRLDHLRAGERSVTAALELSYAHLADEPKRLFRLLAVNLGSDISASAAAALADRADVRAELDILVDERLLLEHQPGRYRFHDLVRAYATERLPDDERAPAAHRLIDWYLSMADTAGATLVPHRNRPAVPAASPGFASQRAALKWSETERANLIVACRQAYDIKYDQAAWRLPMALWDLFYLRKHYSDWITSTELGLTAARRAGDRLGEAWLLTSLGHGYWEVRKHVDALLAGLDARRIWRERGDKWGEGIALHIIAGCYKGLERYLDCVGHYEQALVMHAQADNRWGEGWTLTSLGAAYRELGQIDDALDAAKRALAVWQDLDDRHGTGIALNNLGDIHRQLGSYTSAIECHNQALEVTRAIGNRWGEAWAYNSIGKALRDSGDVAGAQVPWKQALRIFEELGDARTAEVRAYLDGN